jgi:DNA polymerase III alpha subunit (gram-positive type)
MPAHNGGFDMRMMESDLARKEQQAGLWLGRLREAGAICEIDTLTLLSMKALPGFNGASRALGPIYKQGTNEDLSGAHRADVDAKGLSRVLLVCASLQACLLGENVGVTLEVWGQHSKKLTERHAYEKTQRRLLAAHRTEAAPAALAAPTGGAARAVAD